MRNRGKKLTAELVAVLSAVAGITHATDVFISEFMASNASTLTNAFGEAEDWVEIYNDTSSSIDLTGWHLTDSPTELSKWVFPPTSLGSKQYLVVWASNRDTVQNGELHTNFKLDGDGEYLALVRPDGTTVEHEFNPMFPDQKSDFSYGLIFSGNGNQVTLSDSQTLCRYHVPVTDIGTFWRTTPTFDDRAWSSGLTPIGYDRGGTPTYDEYNNTDVETEMYGNMASIYIRIPFVVDDPADLDEFTISMRYEDGVSLYLNGMPIMNDNLGSGETAETLSWNARAQSGRNESLAVTMGPVFSSTDPQAYLSAGTNVLAIQGLNAGTGSVDLLMQTLIEGVLTDGFQTLETGYFSVPTPGAANAERSVDFVKDTSFSVDRGFYSNAFEVTISCATPGSTIRYTLDGSAPTEVSGSVYSGPVIIAGTTVLRAMAYRTGWASSDVDTQTYIFPADVIQQPEQPAGWPTMWAGDYKDYEMDPDIVTHPEYAAAFPDVLTRLPTLSIVTDQEHLFGSSGIYDNSTREGVAWERPASAELIYPDGSKGFQVNCGLRIQGGASRIASRSAKHSFRLLFKEVYGPTKLNYDLFEDSPVDSFDSIILRAGYNNSWIHSTAAQRNRAQYTRDQFTRRAHAAMGQPASRGTYVHLYLNGLYWGIYNPSERPEASFASDHLGGDKDEWDATNSGTTPFTDGDNMAWDAMVSIATNGLSDLVDYEAFRQYCDVENLADYMIINHFIGNGDWDHKNWYAARRRRAGEGYKFFCWDAEQSLTSASGNTTETHNPGKPTDLFHHARTNEEFRVMFGDRLHKHLFNDGALTPSSTSNLWNEISNVLDEVVVAESARWGDWRTTNVPYTVNDHYLPEQTHILNTILPARTAALLSQYSAMGLYPDLAAPEFDTTESCFNGFVAVELSGPADIYYTTDGSDPREYGTGAIQGALYDQEIVLSYSSKIKARCFDGVTWSALTENEFCTSAPSLIISEIMHSPRIPDAGESGESSDAADYQFIELCNAGSDPVGLTGLMFSEGIRFDFSDHELLTLLPGEYAVVVRDRPAFLARYPGLESRIAGEFIGQLSGDGEQIQMHSPCGDTWEITYGAGRDWPFAAAGAGHSLVLSDPDAENLSYGGHWVAGEAVDGSPGADEPGVGAASIRINEIAGHTDLSHPSYPDYDSNDWIELFNAGTTSVSLADYYLSDDPANLLKWGIPASPVMAPGTCLSFDEITGFHAPVNAGFGINKAGEQVLLTYAPGGIAERVVDAVQFKGQENGVTIGRVPDGSDYWVPTLPTRDAENTAWLPRPVISEVMYHPVEPGGTNENRNLEYIELYNPSSAPVELWTVEDGEVVDNWRLRGDVDFDFPDSTTFAAGGRMLLTSFSPTNSTLVQAFTNAYGLTGMPVMFGPFEGRLSNKEGRITLEKPLAPDALDENISWVIVDELFFSESEPWMPSADGLGYALHRISDMHAAADPASWKDGIPSPGTDLLLQPDLTISSFEVVSGQCRLGFELLPDTEYMLEVCTNLTGSSWMPHAGIENQSEHLEPVLPVDEVMFYRLRRN
ncbi:lamin tail domain-containing protein [Pontiellaceae bacterium B12219]|nr:lamin tail domain-containing protein [Pontiellaceae bacterium B12219]